MELAILLYIAFYVTLGLSLSFALPSIRYRREAAFWRHKHQRLLEEISIARKGSYRNRTKRAGKLPR